MPTPPDDPLQFIRTVSKLSGRVAGSVGERQAQELVAGRLHRLGFDAVVEGAVCPPPPPGVLGLHAGFGLLGLLLTWVAPVTSVLLGGLVGLSFWGELRGAPLLLQRLLLRRISGNMVARLEHPGVSLERSDVDRRVIPKILVVAHADVSRSGTFFQPWFRRLWDEREGVAEPPRPGSRSKKRPGLGLHPGTIVLLAATLQAVAAAGVALGLQGVIIPIVIGFAGVVHAGLALLAVDWWRSPPVEGAIDNGSGLSALVSVAGAIAADPLENAELWMVATGDREPDAGGMEAFLFQFGSLLDPANTVVVNLDDVGRGVLHVGTSEGRWDRLPYKPFVGGLAERLARSGRFGEVQMAELIGRTDAGPATEAGFSAVTLTCLIDGMAPPELHTSADCVAAVDPGALAQAVAFTEALVRRLDSELGGVDVGPRAEGDPGRMASDHQG
ncbi:MAG: M28 family peptidase [Deltaproteobacteria bacterium]|nr:M28 family peptidase [Deltaproteobacteria bacterium]